MTKQEIDEYEQITKTSILKIEAVLNVKYWYYEKSTLKYRFRISNSEIETLDISRNVLLNIAKSKI